MKARILVVDDDPVTQRMLDRLLRDRGFEVVTAASADEARARLESSPVDLVLLDLGLPDEDGIALCRQIRARWLMPLIMITARSGPDEKVRGLEVGADDYVTKPFDPDELVARIRAQLRRTREWGDAGARGGRLDIGGGIEIDFDDRDARRQGEPVGLTGREFDVLAFLARYPNKAISRETLFESVWGYQEKFNTNSLDVIVYRIRHKLEDDPSRPQRLVTVRGFGYKLSLMEGVETPR
ncbi:MAG: DNA-binding response regulator [Acidobacteria bacterium]|nr:MAG: DNA-binding response regulator [Acidobacteriota bacterium]